MKMQRREGKLITYALGSCIGICLYDPQIKLASMIHIMLPESSSPKPDNVFKYADTAIDETLRKMDVFGAVRRRMYAKIAGGAKMFNVVGDSNFGNIGERNVQTVVAILQKNGITIKSRDVGGSIARTLLLDAETGEAVVRSFNQPEKKL